jgi:xylulokinase
MKRLFLGLDSSTQGLTATAIDLDARAVAFQRTVNYDADLPAWGTRNGVRPHPDPRVVHAPPLMWVDALELLFDRLREEGADLGAVHAIAVSGQQHGSIYLNDRAAGVLAALHPARPASESLRTALARDTAPIWMDSSTTDECREIRDALGGDRATAELTGSTTFERFTGPQIRRFWKTDPDGYERTASIALVSSFIPSVLAGSIAPIDPGDGAGMNLMDISRRDWAPRALKATAPDLARRLPAIAPSWHIVGPLHARFAKRFGFARDAMVAVGSGDNPCSLVGVGLVRPGDAAISLGTSDTYFGLMTECRTDPHGEGHVFGSPTGDYMSLICFKNGSLARERVRDAFGLDWDGFAAALRRAPPGNGGRLMLPWFVPEIVPRVLRPGVRRFGMDDRDVEANCRGVVEAQMMSMRLHARWMGVRPGRLLATGGASRNEAILRVMADVHGCPVFRFEVSNSAALGAALRAAHAWRRATGAPVGWPEIVAGFTEPAAASRIDPDPSTAAVYDRLTEDYARREREAAGVSAA